MLYVDVLTWLESGGGPLLLLSGKYLAYWEGIDPPSRGRIVEANFRWGDPNAPATDYDRACDVSLIGYLSVIDVNEGQGLVLGGELATAWLPMQMQRVETHGMFIRWLYGEDGASILQAAERVPDDLWEPTNLIFTVGAEPLYVFDATYRGSDVLEGEEHLMIKLSQGSYSIDTAVYEPEQEMLIVLHRFTQINSGLR